MVYYNKIVGKSETNGTQGGNGVLNKLRWKFIGLIMVLGAAVLGAAVAVQTASAVGQYREETDRVLRWVLERGQDGVEPMRPAGGLARDGEQYTLIPAFYAMTDLSGRRVLALSYNADVDEEDVALAVERALASGRQEGELGELGLRYRVRSRGLWLELAFADLGWERSAVRRQALTAALVLGAALAGLFGVSLFLSRRLVRPVEESWKRQRQFVADASHELKTPITVLLADADILLSHPGDTIGDQRRWVEHIRDEGLRMKELVGDLLFLARGDAAGLERPQDKADLTQVCQGCVMSFEPVAFEAGMTLDSRVAPGVTVTGNEEELRRLCAILLDNACKYGAPGGTVTVTLDRGDRAVLTVHNTGEPIPVQAQAHLFERFYRADAARSREGGGYGLGLSIAAAIVERHRGKIAVHSASGEGTAFTVTLPLG